jgi:hypothetical protein
MNVYRNDGYEKFYEKCIDVYMILRKYSKFIVFYFYSLLDLGLVKIIIKIYIYIIYFKFNKHMLT